MQIEYDSFPGELARLFHYYREMLAPDFGFQGGEGCVSWEQVLPNHRDLMTATARLVLLDLAAKHCQPLTSETERKDAA